MKILVVSYNDDNFGDNLIRICFESLLKVALKNHKILESKYTINKMHLKCIDKELVANSDVIYFAGGGLFGLSYLNFFSFIDEITNIADKNDIPVVFSSIGINNMDATLENEELLKNILQKKCITSVGVRENIELFKKYSKNTNLKIQKSSDPAVWTKFVYDIDYPKKNNIIGINVVRGGLFKDNKKNWSLSNEMEYLNEIKDLLDKANIQYVFYTNGSVLDNNTLRYFAKEYDVPKEQIVYPKTTKEVVETISNFDGIVNFRMHSSIIAYSFGIPSIALVWNDKIPFFYESINYTERALDFNEWNSKIVFEKLQMALIEKTVDENTLEYRNYLMLVYKYIFDTLMRVLNLEEQNKMFSFDEVKLILKENSLKIDEDIFDLRIKIELAEKKYFARFNAVRKKNKEISEYKETIKSLKKQNKRQKMELDKLNKMFIIRFKKRIKRLLR